MKTPKDLFNKDPRQLIESNKQSQKMRPENWPTKKTMNLIWLRMSEMYGSAFVSQYGEKPTESWARLLTGISTEQIADGMERVTSLGSNFPPNAIQFRALCEGKTLDDKGNDTSHYHRSAAYININDPKHPSYQPKVLEDHNVRDKRRQKARKAMKSIQGIMKGGN